MLSGPPEFPESPHRSPVLLAVSPLWTPISSWPTRAPPFTHLFGPRSLAAPPLVCSHGHRCLLPTPDKPLVLPASPSAISFVPGALRSVPAAIAGAAPISRSPCHCSRTTTPAARIHLFTHLCASISVPLSRRPRSHKPAVPLKGHALMHTVFVAALPHLHLGVSRSYFSYFLPPSSTPLRPACMLCLPYTPFSFCPIRLCAYKHAQPTIVLARGGVSFQSSPTSRCYMWRNFPIRKLTWPIVSLAFPLHRL